MSDNENNVIVKYSSYTDAQKRATQKYRANNKDKVNEQRKKYYQQRKESDPNFLEYKRAKAREYYQKKKQSITVADDILLSNLETLNLTPNVPPLPEPEPEPEHLPEPELDIDEPIETVEVKPKKKRAPRKKKVVDV
jgi:hypothetical protein